MTSESVDLKNLIAGAWVEPTGDATLTLVNPATGAVTGTYRSASPADVDAAVAAATAASATFKRTTPGQRAAYLLALADAVEAHAAEIVEAQVRNTGQLRAAILSEEVSAGADQLRFFAGAARIVQGLATGEYLEGYTSSIRREPIGVVGQVTPWNYPFAMAIWKIGPALAAGNTIVLKPSDTTPESTVVLARIANEILPPGVLNIVLGDGATGAALVAHPGLGLAAITGSVRAGIAVAAAAASQLTRAHLELGGKAPAIVFADANLDAAATGIAQAAFFNGGQDCTAATRVLVHESVRAEFTAKLLAAAGELKPGLPDDPDAFYGPLNNARHFSEVVAKIAALPAHASILTGGTQVGSDGFYFAPTVIDGVHQDDPIVQEETFGPVLTIQGFSDEAEALALANGVNFGLASSVWSIDHQTSLRMSAALDFGAVWINCHIPLTPEMPHGGFKRSGYGKDLSAYGVEDYTRIKHVMSALD